MMSGRQQYHTASVTMKVENLTKVYSSSTGRVVSLDNVSFSVSKGEFVSVVGPSGSGKSTLLNMLGALDRPTSGKVFMDGIDIFSLNDSQLATVRNDKLGFIFQSYNLINRDIHSSTETYTSWRCIIYIGGWIHCNACKCHWCCYDSLHIC